MYGKDRLSSSGPYRQRAQKVTETDTATKDPVKRARAAMRERLVTKGGRKLR